MSASSYPKVLFVTNSAINDVDAHGALLRNYFHDWPKDRLAHIFQERLAKPSDFCPNEYALTNEDRRLGSIYSKVKRSPVGTAARRHESQQKKDSAIRSVVRRVVYSCSRSLLQSGVWELLFGPKISDGLAAWVQSFGPDVVYVQGYSLFYLWLSWKLHRRFSTSLCLHVLDDWPNTLYSRSPLSFIMRPVVRHCFKKLARASGLRMCIGPDMRDEYRRRYGLEFVPMLNCDEMSRYLEAVPKRSTRGPGLSMVYSGSIGVGRWQSILDVCEAVALLKESGINIHITAYVPDLPPAVSAKFDIHKDVLTVAKSLRDGDVPGALKGADILLLTECFGEPHRTEVKFSIATKAHLYMMAAKPTLVYGPPDVGVVRYAQAEGWAKVITCRTDLTQGLRRLVTDAEEQARLVTRAQQVAMSHHDAPVIRERLRHLIMASLCQNTSHAV